VLKCGFSEEDGGGFSYIKCYSIDFKPRPDGLDEEVLEHGICLDDVVKILPYDELKRKFLMEDEGGGDQDDEEDEPKPKKKARPVKDDEDDEPKKQPTADEAGMEVGDEVRHRKYGMCTITRISGDGTSLTVEDDDGEVHKAVGVAELKKVKSEKPKPGKAAEEDDDDDEEDEPRPTKASRKPATGKKTSRSDDDDDDDDEEEDEPKPKPKSKAKAAKDDDWD